VSVLLLILAIVAFILGIFAPVGDFDFQDLAAFGLACFAAAHLPLGDWVNRG
jgi:hypothetical protein